ncbi:hypothetical protein [Crenalkalicoccus roseus]|uniref:hypothetical protein n=1 Tax=Crenalkalicoccus roseus TaxID=1485588 RepID=UPI0010801E6D|nr:hypothetical protein [Crenalkalicoccus roseus]
MMQLVVEPTDWAILSNLLRRAEQEGWRIAFRGDGIEITSPRAGGGVLALPAALLRHARAEGWHVCRKPCAMALRHPAVRQAVHLRLGSPDGT